MNIEDICTDGTHPCKPVEYSFLSNHSQYSSPGLTKTVNAPAVWASWWWYVAMQSNILTNAFFLTAYVDWCRTMKLSIIRVMLSRIWRWYWLDRKHNAGMWSRSCLCHIDFFTRANNLSWQVRHHHAVPVSNKHLVRLNHLGDFDIMQPLTTNTTIFARYAWKLFEMQCLAYCYG